MNTKDKSKLNGKDLISIGIFTAVYFILNLLIAAAMGFIPLVNMIIPFVSSLVLGIPMMLYFTKIKKFGMVLITYIISGYFSHGYMLPLIAVTAFAGGALAAIFTQMLPGLAMFDVLLSCTTVSEFIGAMDDFRISKKFSVPVSVMFRFFPTIREEYGMIRDALRLRGVGSLAHPLEMLEYRMVPLLTELMQVGNELSASAMTRGLDTPGKRSNVCPMGFHVQDIAVFLLCAAVIALFIFAKVTGR